MPTLAPNEHLTSELLGDCYPYWWLDDDGRVQWEQFADEAAERYPAEQRTVDPVSVLSYLSFQYVCGDRTAMQGLTRLPWLSDLDGTGELHFFPAPRQGERDMAPEEVARRLLELLEAEIVRYTAGKDRVYLLLSGGMDSRVMAAIVAKLVTRGDIDATLEAVTWGRANTRDVVYAEKLAEYAGWDWHWAKLDSESYWRNFEFGATALGAEVDPKHLHRMDWFRDAPENSVVLAASYGDSVGRAEFSSIHLSNVAPLTPSDRNRLMRADVREWAWPRLVADIRSIRSRHGSRSELGWLEIERQAHYMRRMLCHTMCVINRWSRVEQVLTSPEVFGFMWSLDPALRTDQIYVHMLRDLDPHLLEVAWARTGARYDTGEGTDELEKQFHQYGLWLRRDHADSIGELLFGDDTVARMEVFDLDQLHWMYDDWRRERLADDTLLCTQLSYVAALSRYCHQYEVGVAVLSDARAQAGLTTAVKGNVLRNASRASQLLRRTSRPLRMKLKLLRG